jgi:hypothetical protein
MKNSEMFEKQLEELERMPQGAPPHELSRLREQLRQTAAQDSPSSQEQVWAWTRLQARLREEEEQTSAAWLPALKWAAYGAIGLFMVSVFVRFQADSTGDTSLAELSPTPAALVAEAVAAGEGRLPTVAMANPDVHAVSFHSSEAAADVIWATGYNYLPASFDPR